MKVKIRGLVFAGFAAAVFAQSAMAVTPPTEANPSLSNEQVDDLKKTVTSKYYVNENFQERIDDTNALAEDGNGNVVEKAAFIGWNYGQNAENKEWVKLEGNKQINGTTEYVQIVHDNKNGSKHYVELNTNAITSGAGNILSASSGSASDTQKLTTAGAVYGLLDREGTNAGSTLSSSSSDNTVPTSKNVYDFVTEELDGMGANIKGNETYHTQKVLVVTQAWATAQNYDSTMITGTPTDGDLAHADHWELIVPDSVVAESGSDIWNNGAGPASGDYNDLTTAKAVYDVLTDDQNGFQPKVGKTAADSNKLRVGYRSYNSTTGEYGESEWATIQAYNDAEHTGDVNPSTGYLTITDGTSRGVYDINLNNSMVVNDGSVLLTAGASATATDNKKLTTAKSVYDLLDREGAGASTNTTTITANSTDATVPTSKNVFDFVTSVTGGNTLPTFDNTGCGQAGVHCALVSSYTPGAEPGDEGTISLEWTVMAQAQ